MKNTEPTQCNFIKLYLYDTCLRLDEGIEDKKYIILHQIEILTTVTSHQKKYLHNLEFFTEVLAETLLY